jgi:1-acyl-sn-glycerol-3-phosphate acyltransferase
MQVTIQTLAELPVPVVRTMLPDWVAAHVDATPDVHAAMRTRVEAVVAAASDEDLRRLQATFASAGEGYRLHPANPVARAVTRAFMSFLSPGWVVDDLERLDRFLTEGPRRRVLVCNHLSYTDTQLTDSILCMAGRVAVADRLVAIAGPKVYTDPWRRMAAIALNTRKTAQSSAVATEQAALGPRELAAVAFETIRDCERLMDEGYLILLYPEGSRSRTGQLRPFLRAASRYLQLPDTQILPIAQTGSEGVFPIDSPIMHPLPVRIAVGHPFASSTFPAKGTALAEAHARVAALLPEPYRPDPDDAALS